MSEEKQLAFETRALHCDGHGKPMHAHVWPIFQTSSFVFDSPEHGRALFAGEQQGHIYSRLGNPTVEALENTVKELEGGHASFAFGSGMGAITCSTMPFLHAGEHIIVGDTLYGCTVDLFHEHFHQYALEVTAVDTSSMDAIKSAWKPNTKMIYLETPANPTNKISDIGEIAKFAHERNALVVVDGTFSSPYFLKPLKLGADMALHSVTKYISGHGDVVAGVLTVTTEDQAKICRGWRKVTGGLLGPQDAFLVLRGIRTLQIRMERIQQTALTLAKWLHDHPAIEKVNHPGLEDFPGHDIAMKQMSGVGGTFSFTMRGGYEAAKRLLEEVKICTVCVSLGSVDTLIEHPASMTHACVPEELMIKQGLTKNMVRISVGLENVEDLKADLAQALEKCEKPKA
ncbi:Methionine gamma-lyase 1 [Monocercomonoides exilis]|uniref:Methionine gamma-lyase 1 n=1 Tax=Monocercomonoides exilis TaxID=2049356 RepID=UPI00355A7272|nr:Methionine gamma-lyase 1 [Monocercomonoides exilis]|eukprot:MONOS_917.1-p1 / transcript=MONOS_917.1 / gene=MONOS_917 / organism=Monocercomonoides_exilis_PA203 / gene_product=Methionine gamma-lyase 1 / transcript_product=Methionine gamma-lyase 1 / location=Mono_scaffold00015:132664-133919(-) / protein_length=400 / sequence_SO=supercontig / SO=protein_coding / is_pseudo=false